MHTCPPPTVWYSVLWTVYSRETAQMRPVASDCCRPMLMVLLNMLGLLMPALGWVCVGGGEGG